MVENLKLGFLDARWNREKRVLDFSVSSDSREVGELRFCSAKDEFILFEG